MGKVLYTNIVDDLENKIKTGELSDGAKLPSERVMAEKYSVSRNVVREAYKVLSEKGLVDIQMGKGAYVCIPKDNVLTTKLEEAITISKSSTLEEILEVREILETAVAKKAVSMATKENIRNLELIYDRMEQAIGDNSLFAEEDTNFHIELAKCTGNSTLVLLINTFNNISDKKLYKLNALYSNRFLKAQKEHKDIIEAIKDRDEARMMLAIDSHINCLAAEMKMLK